MPDSALAPAPTQLLDATLYNHLLAQAALSPRLRAHHNLHQSLDEPIQRLLIGLQAGTYIRPHRHSRAQQWEMLLALKGTVRLLLFDADGVIEQAMVLAPDGDRSGIQIAAGQWHSLLPLQPEAVIMEVKPGPFQPTPERDFAAWAPAEGAEDTTRFLSWARDAKPSTTFR